MKHLFVIIGALLGLFLGVYLFNIVHAWTGIIVFCIVAGLSINYLIKQLKKY